MQPQWDGIKLIGPCWVSVLCNDGIMSLRDEQKGFLHLTSCLVAAFLSNLDRGEGDGVGGFGAPQYEGKQSTISRDWKVTPLWFKARQLPPTSSPVSLFMLTTRGYCKVK